MKKLTEIISEGMIAKALMAEARQKGEDDEEEGDDAPNRHILVQMHKAITMGGKKEVEFKNGDKVNVEPEHAHKFLKKYIATQRPADKLKLTDQAAASHKDFLDAIK